MILKWLFCVHGAHTVQMAVDWGYTCHFFLVFLLQLHLCFDFPESQAGPWSLSLAL